MVKLTVLYNLPEDMDEQEFIAWRTGKHQVENATAPHVLKTDFYVAQETQMGKPRYRFITEAYYETMEDLNASFFSEEAQAQLQKDKVGNDMLFLVSEQMAFTNNQKD